MLRRGLWHWKGFSTFFSSSTRQALRDIFNNFNSYLAILSAIESSPVSRLDWPDRVIKSLEEPRALIDNKGSFKNYREAFARAKPPCIPYMWVETHTHCDRFYSIALDCMHQSNRCNQLYTYTLQTFTRSLDSLNHKKYYLLPFNKDSLRNVLTTSPSPSHLTYLPSYLSPSPLPPLLPPPPSPSPLVQRVVFAGPDVHRDAAKATGRWRQCKLHQEMETVQISRPHTIRTNQVRPQIL